MSHFPSANQKTDRIVAATPAVNPLLKNLEGTDRRSTAGVAEVVAAVLVDPRLFGVVFDGMLAGDPVMRMRCADAVEKITARHHGLLAAHKRKLLYEVAAIDQQGVRWHAAQLFSRLRLNRSERRKVKDILWGYLADESRIVRTFAMQALADLAAQDAELRGPILRKLQYLTRTGSPAMRSRGRKLLANLNRRP
jgi:hypothetical protein